MLLLRQTSIGRVLFDFGPSRGIVGENAEVHLLDQHGWSTEGEPWRSRDADGGSLADAIVRAGRLPAEEAERLAKDALAEWRERGADHMPLGSRMKIQGLLVVILSVLPLLVLAFLVWLLVRLL